MSRRRITTCCRDELAPPLTCRISLVPSESCKIELNPTIRLPPIDSFNCDSSCKSINSSSQSTTTTKVASNSSGRLKRRLNQHPRLSTSKLNQNSAACKIDKMTNQQEERRPKCKLFGGINNNKLLLSVLLLINLINCQVRISLSQATTSTTTTIATSGCPYPPVGTNCQVQIVNQAPAVPLVSADFVSDEYANLKPDTQASYKCDQGYELLGQETLTCLQSGKWSSRAPSCVTNIAIGKPTNQSSTVKGGESRNANDGRLTTQHEGKFCTETKVDQSPWWQIDLLQLYEIKSIRLLGRACCNAQMSLHDIEIRVGNSSTLTGNRLCAWYPNNLDEGVAKDFQCAHPIVGRFVSIQMVGIEAALSLCEVMVFSKNEFPADRCGIQSTLAPTSANKPVTTTTTSATITTSSQSSTTDTSLADSKLPIVFNRTCYEMQTTNGGSFLVADTYCKARGGALLHSVNNLTQVFIANELEKMRSKLKSKLVWLGAKREVSSPNSLGPITPGSTSAFAPFLSDLPVALPLMLEKRSLHLDNPSAALEEFAVENMFSGDHGLTAVGEPSPISAPLRQARTSLFQVSSGAGGSTSRGSQTFGLPSVNTQHHASNGTIAHPQRSLIVSQPNQVASFFNPPIPITSDTSISGSNNKPTISLPPQTTSSLSSPSTQASTSQPSSPISFASHRTHQSLRPPSLVTQATPSPVAPQPQQPTTWSQLPSTSTQQSHANSNWRWVGDSPSETIQSLVTSFLWADDQPNNYNNQQDCMVLDGAKKWLWNDVTCELDYLPWVCQYRPSTCGSPDRHENSTILEMISQDTNGVSIQEPAYQFDKTITYACPVGHKLDGSRQRRCQYDGTWSGKAPKCQYVDCGPLSSQSIENGRLVYLNQSQTTYGSQVKYVCYEDYVLVGQDLRQCQGDGKWAGKQPYCAYKWCPQLPQIPNGFLNVSSYSENSIATYTCNGGYKLIGNDTRQCLLGGKWTNQEPFCQYVDCGQPKQIANGNYQLVNSTTNYLSVASYTCNDNYTLVGGNNKLICSANNRWSGKEPQCSLINCGQPQANPGSSFSGDSFTVHSVVDYKCDLGFKEVSGSTQRTCGLNGQWTGQPISCKYVDCGRVPAILKGEVSYINGTTYLASQVSYECTPGNRLSGHRVRFCGPDGRWTGTSPKCEEIRCDAPELPANGSAIYIGNDRSFKEQSFSVGVTVQYECDYGHVVRGNWASRLCQANGEWSGEPPVCKFVDCGPPPMIENGNLVLKHPPAGSVGSATLLERRSDPNSSSSSSSASSGSSLLATLGLGGSGSSSTSQQAATFTYYGTIAHFSCDPNYKIQGPAQRECLESGQWRRPLPTCEPVQCPKPEHFDEYTQVSYVSKSSQSSQSDNSNNKLPGTRLITNNQWLVNQESLAYGVGDKLYYSCQAGYELYGGPEVRTCTQYGQWSGSSTPRCRLIDCGRPAPIGAEGRFYLLNETTTFNSIVEYSCIRPFKLIEQKIRMPGSLIETLTMAQAGVSSILTSLPIGVKVCANNGQWMPNDQQPKCLSASAADNLGDSTSAGGSSSGGPPQFDGGDNTLDGASRGAGGQVSNGRFTTSGGGDNGLAGLDSSLDSSITGQHHSSGQQNGSTSMWAKFMVAFSMLVMLALIVLTIICIRSGKRVKQPGAAAVVAALHHHHGQQHPRASMMHNGHHPGMQALHLGVNGAIVGPKGLQQHQVAQQQAAMLAASQQQAAANQSIYLNALHKMGYPQNGQAPPAAQMLAQQQVAGSGAYGDAGLMPNVGRQMIAINGGGEMMMMNGKSSSLGMMAHQQQRAVGVGIAAPMHHNQQAPQMSANSSASVMDSYSRLSIDSDQSSGNGNVGSGGGGGGGGGQHHSKSTTIRHNPNGLVTFVSPANQQQRSGNHHSHQNQTSVVVTSGMPMTALASSIPTQVVSGGGHNINGNNNSSSNNNNNNGGGSTSGNSSAASSNHSSSSPPTSQQSSHNQVSPQSISTSLSVSSTSPSSQSTGSSSAHHTSATRLATTDSSSSGSRSANDGGVYQAPIATTTPAGVVVSVLGGQPPSLPAHPPPPHRLQQHNKQLMKSRQNQQQQQQQPGGHYMEPDN